MSRRTARAKTTPKPGRKTPASSDDSGFPVVGIGASAGGLEALEALIKNLPENSGMAFVVVTHQHPGHTSMLPDLLGRSSRLPVVQAADGVKVAPDRVYVGPPGSRVEIMKGRLQLLELKAGETPHLPIDYFFRSLAQDQTEKAICIVLSGNGTDGTLGLRAIKGESGMAMAQEPSSAKYTGMPSSAIATGLADYVLPPAKMPEQLIAYAHGPYLRGKYRTVKAPLQTGEPMQKILLLLRSRTRHDFSSYKPSTVLRRIERRMNVHQIKDPSTYLRLLQENAHELDVLFQELLISVTSFFRDGQAYEVLAKKVLPDLVKACADDGTLRIWVPGCSTGEEAYSLAILLREVMERLKRRVEVHIFATDLDSKAIIKARSGVYPDGIAVDVSPERLDHHFVRENGGYRIRQDLREMVIFAPQSVIADPPFTKLDLISCRNLLIYFDNVLQKRLIPIFHYALKPGGILFLGPSETVGNFNDLFTPIDAKWKIFRRREAGKALHPLQLPRLPAEPRVAGREDRAKGLPASPSLFTVVEKTLLERYVPPSVVVNDRGDILHIHGRTGAYLEPAAGQPRLNVLDMAREGLEPMLASAMREARAGQGVATRENIQVKANGARHLVALTASVLRDPESLRGMLLITFRPGAPEPTTKRAVKRPPPAPRVRDLERELRYTKESLRSTVEELETSNEELKSANEELQSMNEELQSTNEEIETSKEEMQSLNEELSTVNSELQLKLDDLARSNDDMLNLLNSIELATIFVDHQLCIKRYTEQATRLVKLIASDLGRPLSDLVTNLKYEHFLDDAREVLHSLVYKEVEVQTTDDQWYLMRLAPYRTADNRIDGLVITFVNISRLKRAETDHADSRRLFASLIDGLPRPAVVLDAEQRVIAANRAFQELSQTAAAQLLGRRLRDVGEAGWNLHELTEPVQRALDARDALPALRLDVAASRFGRRSFVVRGWPLDHGVAPGTFVLEIENASESETARR